MTIRTPVNSYVLTSGDGSQTTFAFPFSQFETDDLFVLVWNNSTEQWDVKTSGTHYNVSASTIVFTAGNIPGNPPSGVTGNILVIRKTDIDEDFPKATFASGSSIKANDLNNNQKQALRSIKELRDTYLSAYSKIDESTGVATNPKMYANLDMTGRRIYNVGAANSDDDVVTREQLGDVIALDITGDTAQGVVLNKTQSGSNSGDEMEISIADSSPSQKGSVIIEQAAGEAINVSYSSGTATIGVDRSTALQQGVVTVSEAATTPIIVTYTADGEVEIDIDKSTAGQQGVVRVSQAAGEAANVTYTADGEVEIGVDKSTASQQGVVQLSSTSPISLTRPADGEVNIELPDGTVNINKLDAASVVNTTEQLAGAPVWTNDDTALPTIGAAALRFDTIVDTVTPTGSQWEIGKTWLQNDSNKTLSIWDGSAWLGVASGGTFTTQPTVIYVDAVNGDDTNDGHRIINPMRTIKAAVASANDGDLIIVNPGVYQEICPIDITVRNLSIVGTALRSCFVHPTAATETNSMFRVNSGSYLANLTLSGVKASGTVGGNTQDPGSTYGLPTNQGWLASFYPNAIITKSPYIYNCTNFSDSGIDNSAFNPNSLGGGYAGDLTSAPSGGGLLIDGSAVSSSSPLRSMVCDSFTHVGLNGPGILVTNNGYVQATSSYAFFTRYHIKAKNGGQANLSASTSDFGNYALIADGRSPSAIFTATTSAGSAANSTTFTIGAPTAQAGWFGSATRPANNMLVDVVDSNGTSTYPVISSTANGSGWTVEISNPDSTDRSVNLGLSYAVSSGAAVSFYLRSMVASSGHTMEYVGSGTDYRALPENGGVPDETKQVVEINNGRVWVVSVDHKGTLKAGDTFKVDQQTGFVTIPSGAIRFNNYVERTSGTGAALIPAGSTAERDGAPSAGYLRFNSDTSSFEGYDGAAWGSIGGSGGGSGGGSEFITTPQTFTVNKSIASNTNAGMMGPVVTIDSGVSITVGANSILTLIK